MTNHQKGLLCEYFIMCFLRCKGYFVIAHRFCSPFGEIDIVAQKKRTLNIIEVKYRKSLQEGLDALDRKKLVRLRKSASCFLKKFPCYTSYDLEFHGIIQRPWAFPFHVPHVLGEHKRNL